MIVIATAHVGTSACAGPKSDKLLSLCRGIYVNRPFAPRAGQPDLRVGGLQRSDSVSTLPDPIRLNIQFPPSWHSSGTTVRVK